MRDIVIRSSGSKNHCGGFLSIRLGGKPKNEIESRKDTAEKLKSNYDPYKSEERMSLDISVYKFYGRWRKYKQSSTRKAAFLKNVRVFVQERFAIDGAASLMFPQNDFTGQMLRKHFWYAPNG